MTPGDIMGAVAVLASPSGDGEEDDWDDGCAHNWTLAPHVFKAEHRFRFYAVQPGLNLDIYL